MSTLDDIKAVALAYRAGLEEREARRTAWPALSKVLVATLHEVGTALQGEMDFIARGSELHGGMVQFDAVSRVDGEESAVLLFTPDPRGFIAITHRGHHFGTSTPAPENAGLRDPRTYGRGDMEADVLSFLRFALGTSVGRPGG
jgi:hypothetical protein